MQISYHFALTKIQKLQNLKNNDNKNKNKNFFSVLTGIVQNWPVRSEHGRYGRYFFRYETGGVNRTDFLAGTVYTGQYGTILTPLVGTDSSLILW